MVLGARTATISGFNSTISVVNKNDATLGIRTETTRGPKYDLFKSKKKEVGGDDKSEIVKGKMSQTCSGDYATNCDKWITTTGGKATPTSNSDGIHLNAPTSGITLDGSSTHMQLNSSEFSSLQSR